MRDRIGETEVRGATRKKKKSKRKETEEEGKWKPRLRRRRGVVCEEGGGEGFSIAECLLVRANGYYISVNGYLITTDSIIIMSNIIESKFKAPMNEPNSPQLSSAHKTLNHLSYWYGMELFCNLHLSRFDVYSTTFGSIHPKWWL